VGAAFIFGEGMDFIEDDPADGAESGEPALLAEEDAQAFGRGEENVRRRAELLLAFVTGGVAGTEADLDGRFATVDGGERRVQIFFEVVGKRAQGRNVDGVNAGFERAIGFEQGEFVQDGEECGQGFAGAGCGNDEDVASGFDVGPGGELRGSGFSEFLREPLGDDRWL
jgi:hypothetical protein